LVKKAKKTHKAIEKRVLAGNILKQIQIKNFSSTRAFAEEKGIPLRTLGRITRAEANPSLETLIAISRGLNCPLTNLFQE